ncbi:hypothetical protein [Sphingobium abikonense]|uniref:hypothetical protein n=1 Tax=Sphingobium abikonense TaxID=86193 RepID=UPI00351369DE
MAEKPLDLSEAISLYLDLKPDEAVDLEVAASMAIQWSKAAKAAGRAIEPEFDYRVTLIAAKPGSSKWLAAIERSPANQAALRVKRGWEKVPFIVRFSIGLAVVIPTTAVPTWKYWTDDDSFSERQEEQITNSVRKAISDPGVETHKKSMFRDAQKDNNIKGVGGGVPASQDWRPKKLIPSDQFAESGGLFAIEDDVTERTINRTLDVILVAPDLENAHKTWVFKQEGIPGQIRAIMKDDRFLAALDQGSIKEDLRTGIPMTIRLRTTERRIDGNWKVKRKGRVVAEVISPMVG